MREVLETSLTGTVQMGGIVRAAGLGDGSLRFANGHRQATLDDATRDVGRGMKNSTTPVSLQVSRLTCPMGLVDRGTELTDSGILWHGQV